MNIPLMALTAILGLANAAGAQEPPERGGEAVAQPTAHAAPGPAGDAEADPRVVTVDVAVLDHQGNPIRKIPRSSFRVLEDNIPQTVTRYASTPAPMTVALVVEFSDRFQSTWSLGWLETLSAVYGFSQTLQRDDAVAIIAYDLHTELLCDFTNDRGRIEAALQRLRVPGFSDSNLFDALGETADRMSKIDGRKAIVVITSGIDTFSKLTYDKARNRLQQSAVPIYPVGTLRLTHQTAEAQGAGTLDFLQSDLVLRTIAKETGGQAFFPRFQGEVPAVFQQISQTLRHQYALGYVPTNQAKDGKFRKITVELVDPTGHALRLTDDKGVPISYTVVAKARYTAPQPAQ